MRSRGALRRTAGPVRRAEGRRRPRPLALGPLSTIVSAPLVPNGTIRTQRSKPVASSAARVTAAPAVAPAAVVRLREVAKTYRSGSLEVPALRGISLEIPSHRFSVVIGASGSGKTTLLNLIGCIDTPTRGALEVCGENIGALGDEALS